MLFVLAAFAIVVPVVLVVQSVRGRVRLQCCATHVTRDLRMRDAWPVDADTPGT
jgi:hypothetical protein